MTPAIRLLEAKQISFRVHPYEPDPKADSYGDDAAEKLGVSPERVFKTLIARAEDTLVMAILPVAGRLDLKTLAAVMDAKKAELADPKSAEKATGYVIGGISPIGGRKSLPTLLDETASLFETIYVSAGQRGLQIELAPVDLQELIRATLASITRD